MQKSTSRSYFLSGAAGFVGANLLRRLVGKKCSVDVLLKRDSATWRIEEALKSPYVTVHFGDLSDVKSLTVLMKKIAPDVIYHLAARGAYSRQNDASDIFETNVIGTLNLLTAAAEVPYALFVNTGSSSEYGLKRRPMKESDVLEPNSYYAVAKAAATHLGEYIAKSTDKPIVTLRLFSVFGPYEAPTRFFPTLMTALAESQPMQLVSPKIARDFIYIDDVVDLYMNVPKLRQFGGQVFNVGTGKQSSIENVVKMAQKVTGRRLECQWQKMPAKTWDTDRWVADMSKTRELLGWMPKNTVEQGIEKMWSWHQKQQ